jgi:hypothetical protein
MTTWPVFTGWRLLDNLRGTRYRTKRFSEFICGTALLGLVAIELFAHAAFCDVFEKLPPIKSGHGQLKLLNPGLLIILNLRAENFSAASCGRRSKQKS